MGWRTFAFVAGEPFTAPGYLQNVQSPITGLFEVVLGTLVRLAAFFGGVLMVLFYLGNADWATGYVNGDLLGLVMFVIVSAFAAGRILGVDASLEETEFVRRRPWLRYLLG